MADSSSRSAAAARVSEFGAWIQGVLSSQGTSAREIVPASSDASFRHYSRVLPERPAYGEATLIAMDAPPPQEDCRPFVRIASMMHEAGLNVPRVFAQDIERGFLMLSDLGTRSYLAALQEEEDPRPLFADATDALVRWQLATQPGALPPYDAALLRRELELFPEWYVKRHLGAALSAEEQHALGTIFDLLVADHTSQPQVFVHRDFMPRNLMVATPNPGVLDFQDAVIGPISYDVMSLYKDAFISWDEERALDGIIRYWEKARAAGLPVDADFYAFFRAAEWMGLQRHLKVLGIFARICHRDGKPDYVRDTPRFLAYAGPVVQRYRELAPLYRLLQRLAEVDPAVRAPAQ